MTAEPPLDVPVLLLGYKRPETTLRVIEAMGKVEPGKIYLAVDGPRPGVTGERESVDAVCRVMTEGINWSSEVKTLFREENAGLKEGVSGALDWFFDQEEMGIILEDDCVPDPSFFVYCRDLLHRFRNDERVMHISGACHFDPQDFTYSYFFSRYPLVWGWASWASAWKKNRLDLGSFDEEFSLISSRFGEPGEVRYWEQVIRKVISGRISTWDYLWAMTVWRNGGLAINPTVNLVRNIGFSTVATNTALWKDYRGWRLRGAESLGEIRHPPVVEENTRLDSELFRGMYRKPALPQRILKAAGTVIGEKLR